MTTFHRRQFLGTSAGALSVSCFGLRPGCWPARQTFAAHTFGIIPVLGDGKWIWREPPTDQVGYLEPRDYDVSVTVRWIGTGRATNLRGSTVAPVQMDEQKIVDFQVEASDCQAAVHQYGTHAAQLEVVAAGIEPDQTIEASARYRMNICKAYMGHQRDHFPAEQSPPRDIADDFLGNSPGIQCKTAAVRDLAAQLAGAGSHPWDKAKAFHAWVWENIKGRYQPYTSVRQAIENRVGDCEERAAVFVAFCRAVGIPARLVWVPSHNWAEFFLLDHQNNGHWIPAHTAAYSWFGWTGAHELVLQKGDRIRLPQRQEAVRLITDWMQWQGAKPKVEFVASVIPVAADGQEAGPGGREKLPSGKWKLVGEHSDNRYMRSD